MKLILIFLLLIAFLNALKDKYYIKLLQEEIKIRDDIIKDLNNRGDKNDFKMLI